MIEFGKLGRCVVEGCFDGGSMTSDGEVMLLGATDRKLGLLQAAARCIAVPRNPLLTAHEHRGDDATGIGPAGQQLQLAQCRHLCAGHAPVAHALVWCSGALAFAVGTAHAQVRSQITQVNPPVDRSLLGLRARQADVVSVQAAGQGKRPATRDKRNHRFRRKAIGLQCCFSLHLCSRF